MSLGLEIETGVNGNRPDHCGPAGNEISAKRPDSGDQLP
jgi:hypothetical protein